MRTGLTLLGLSLLLLFIMAVWTIWLPGPVWTRNWPSPPRFAPHPSTGGAAVTVRDLAGLGRGFLPAPAGIPSGLRPGKGSLDLAASLSAVHASIRAAAARQWESSSLMMASYLKTRVAESLADQERAWQERLDRRREELAEEDGRLLAAYAAKIREEALPGLSALQMELALCPGEDRRAILEKEIGRHVAAIEEDISRKRTELAEAREYSLEELRHEAGESLKRSAAELNEEARRALADHLHQEEEAYSAWLSEDLRTEAALMEIWGAGPKDESREIE